MTRKSIDMLKFKQIRQKDPIGCILVNLEIALKYFGEFRYNEKELIKHTIESAFSFPNIPSLLNPLLKNPQIKFKSFKGNLLKLKKFLKEKIDK